MIWANVMRLQQMYRGVPVWANDLYVHINAKDEVYAVNGRYAPTPVQVRSTEASLSAANATEIVHSDLRQKSLPAHHCPETRRALRMPEPARKGDLDRPTGQQPPGLAGGSACQSARLVHLFRRCMGRDGVAPFAQHRRSGQRPSIIWPASPLFRAFQKNSTYSCSATQSDHQRRDGPSGQSAGGLWVI